MDSKPTPRGSSSRYVAQHNVKHLSRDCLWGLRPQNHLDCRTDGCQCVCHTYSQ
jgi:hypothetical protein